MFLHEWAYAYGRAGRRDEAQRLFDALKDREAAGENPGDGGWASAYLAIGDERRALEALERAARKAANHESDEGFWSLMNLLLKQGRFREVLARVRGN